MEHVARSTELVRVRVLQHCLNLVQVADVVLRDRDDDAFLRDLNQRLEMEAECYELLVSTGTFTHGHVQAGCLPELLGRLVPGGHLICTVHRDIWDKGGFSNGLRLTF